MSCSWSSCWPDVHQERPICSAEDAPTAPRTVPMAQLRQGLVSLGHQLVQQCCGLLVTDGDASPAETQLCSISASDK